MGKLTVEGRPRKRKTFKLNKKKRLRRRLGFLHKYEEVEKQGAKRRVE